MSVDVLKLIHDMWIVPAGMIALYFYGRFHFNTPVYQIDFTGQAASSAIGASQLLTMAPPKLTTRRSRYNRYALWYVCGLQIIFILVVFVPNVISNSGTIMHWDLPKVESEGLQYRVLVALFALTGLLSSFPGFKQVDDWVLRKLHRAALIPDDVRELASKLSGSKFVPPPDIIGAARGNLTLRDTANVVDGKASGLLESKVFSLLCLMYSFDNILRDDKYTQFKITWKRDLDAGRAQINVLRADARAYLRDQERLVPQEAKDIDDFLDQRSSDEKISILIERRKAITTRLDAAYELLCLLVSLSILAVEFSSDAIDEAIKTAGFDTKITPKPVLNWDTIGLVTVATFVLMLAFNGLFVVIALLLNFEDSANIIPDKRSVLRFTVLFTAGYAICMWIAITLRRRWIGSEARNPNRPEELIIALVSYVCTVPLNIIISLYIRHGEFTYAPFLFALNQAVFAYFIAKYVERSMTTNVVSYELALLQAGTQATVALIATQLSPYLFLTVRPNVFVGVFSVIQSGVSGYIVAVLFQRFYGRSNVSSAEASALS